mgnify:CR=1 FL=1|tara:strand:- start:218 stop:1897 length:1680 start_codon:yes stop_codon:yes gene_type:complete
MFLKRSVFTALNSINSIFIRVYGGMLLSILLVSLICYWFFTNQFLTQQKPYQESVLLGSLYLLAEGLAQTEEAQRLHWFDQTQQLFGVPFAIRSEQQLDLTPSLLSKLRTEGQLMRQTSSKDDLEGWMRVPDQKQPIYIHLALNSLGDAHVRGLVRLLSAELDSLDPAQWSLFVEQFQQYFEGPLQLRQQPKPSWTAEFIQRVQLGEVAMSMQHLTQHEILLTAVGLTPDRSQYLVLGPVSVMSVFSEEMLVFYALVAIIIMGLSSYFLVRPLLRRLYVLQETLVKIRRHDLSARVSVDRHDAFGRLAGTFNDMADHIQRLIHAQREMMNAVSHEFRTPVARIRFGLEFLIDEDERDGREERLKEIDKDIQELETLIDEILTYAVLEEGTPSLEFTAINVHSLLEQVKKESDALGKPLTIQVTPQPNIFNAEGEQRYIHRVVQNLVGNACQYAFSQVRLSTHCETGMCRIDIEDDGPGIPADQWQKVFVPFARLDNSRTRTSGGYGLGLSIVQRIAYWHGGIASVSDSELGGAKFTFLWPMSQSFRHMVHYEHDSLKSY